MEAKNEVVIIEESIEALKLAEGLSTMCKILRLTKYIKNDLLILNDDIAAQRNSQLIIYIIILYQEIYGSCEELRTHLSAKVKDGINPFFLQSYYCGSVQKFYDLIRNPPSNKSMILAKNIKIVNRFIDEFKIFKNYQKLELVQTLSDLLGVKITVIEENGGDIKARQCSPDKCPYENESIINNPNNQINLLFLHKSKSFALTYERKLIFEQNSLNIDINTKNDPFEKIGYITKKNIAAELIQFVYEIFSNKMKCSDDDFKERKRKLISADHNVEALLNFDKNRTLEIIQVISTLFIYNKDNEHCCNCKLYAEFMAEVCVGTCTHCKLCYNCLPVLDIGSDTMCQFCKKNKINPRVFQLMFFTSNKFSDTKESMTNSVRKFSDIKDYILKYLQ